MTHMIVPCSRCGTRNRVPRDRMHQHPLCGKCGARLIAGETQGRPVSITDASFEREVLSDPGIVLVDFWAPWCGPCRQMTPVLDELAAGYRGKIKIAKLNVDENPLSASRYDTRSIPTLLLFKGGTLVDRIVGAVPRIEIENRIGMALKS